LSESKEFDEVIKPAPREEVEKLQSVKDPNVEENKDEEDEGLTEEEKEWKPYFEHINKGYANTVRQVGMRNQYSIPIVNGDGTKKDTLFNRKRCSVKELRKIAALQKEYTAKPKDKNSLADAEALASLYLEYAEMLLINATTEKPISKEEFEQQDWGTIRAIIDDAILKSLQGSTG